MNADKETYVFGRIGQSNTVHIFRKTENYNPSCICGSNGWHHSKKSDANLTEKDVTCKKCLARLGAQKETAPVQAEAPKYQVGDKMLFTYSGLDGDCVTIHAYDAQRQRYGVQYQSGEIGETIWLERQLVPYVESEERLVIVPDFLAEHRKQVEQLEARIANDAAYMTNLEAKNEKLEGNLAAAQAIIVQAGATAEKKSRSLLDAIEANVTLKKVLDEIYVLSLDEIFEDTEASEKYLNNQLDKINRIALTCRSKSASEESPNAAQAVTLSEDVS